MALRLTDHLEGSTDVLVLLDPEMTGVPGTAALPAGAEIRSLTQAPPRSRDRDAVLLAVRDLVGLRRAVTGLAPCGTARRVGIWIERATTTVPSVTPRPEWPRLDEIVASGAGEQFVLLTFSAPTPVRPVLLQLARAASPAGAMSSGWPSLGVRRDDPTLWPVADPGATVALPRRLFDESVDFPPDLVLLSDTDDVPDVYAVEDHPMLGRPPRVRELETRVPWASLRGRPEGEVADILSRLGPASLGAVDEKLLNPIGFDRTPLGEAARLRQAGDRMLEIAADGRRPGVVIDGDHGVSEADIPLLRQLPAVELAWQGTTSPQSYCRVVVGLAMAGVPLVTDEVPKWAGHLLAADLVETLRGPVDLSSRLAREEHSVRVRRAALRNHATEPWRRDLASEAGLQTRPARQVSVLLVTRRPDMLPFALGQIARQRGLSLEVVVATHGFEVDPAVVQGFEDSTGIPLESFDAEATSPFGDVLNRAAGAASGDVLLKMDDDDWYGPDFASDLLTAQSYSGGAIVGCPPEFTFVEPLWVTTRRPDLSEAFRPFVAGGTMLIDRAAFREVGGFRSTRKYVDANLLSAVIAAGGTVYRTHGLGYVLRRGHQGHTWDPGLGYFVSRQRAGEQWRGFRPSALLEARPEDVPAKPASERVLP